GLSWTHILNEPLIASFSFAGASNRIAVLTATGRVWQSVNSGISWLSQQIEQYGLCIRWVPAGILTASMGSDQTGMHLWMYQGGAWQERAGRFDIDSDTCTP